MKMDVVFGKARLLRAMTSLEAAEFTRLEAGLEKLLIEERQARRYDGGVRQRAYGAGGETSKLPTARAKLLFLLFYFKAYPPAGGHGVFLRAEPAAGLRMDPAPVTPGEYRVGAGMAPASQKAR